MEPLRVVHFADIHIGMENYGHLDPSTGTSTRVRDFLDRLDEVVDYALENEADLAVFAGDAFKTRDPDPTQQRELARRIKRLSTRVPTLMVVGNHDMPGMAVKASSLDIFQALHVPGIIVGNKPGSRVLETRHGPLFLAWMPYPMRNRLLTSEEHRGKTIEELEIALRDTVSDKLRNLAAEAKKHAMPRLLAGHFTVDRAIFGSERSVMLGKDVAVSTSMVADAAWDYVALGHLHRHQDLGEGSYPPVVYSGSLERIDFGEEGEQKGFCWVELARSETTWRFIPVAAREFQTVDVDVRSEDDPTQKVEQALRRISASDTVVRVRIQMLPHQESVLNNRDVERMLEGATSVIIAKEVETEMRSRLGDLSPETLTPLQLLERYFQAREETDERIATLLTKAEEILNGTR